MKIVWMNNTIVLQTKPNSEEMISATEWYNGTALEILTGLKQPAMPIYFGMTKLASSPIKADEVKTHFPDSAKGTLTLYSNQINAFAGLCHEHSPDDVFIVTIDKGALLIFSPCDESWRQISDVDGVSLPVESKNKTVVNPKYYHVRLIAEIPLVQTPPILSSIKRNTAIRNTPAIATLYPAGKSLAVLGDDNYRENVLAVLSVLSQKVQKSKEIAEYVSETIAHSKFLIRCLSDTQLETLVAKMFEDEGYHVSAYRGGSTADSEYVITPMKEIDQYLSQNVNHPSPTIRTVQVKRRLLDSKVKDLRADILVTGEVYRNKPKGDIEIVDGAALLSRLRQCEAAKKWLGRELTWFKNIGMSIDDFLN